MQPYERPEAFDTRVQRIRSWLRARKIEAPGELRAQATAFLAASIAAEALAHNYNFFVRDFLVEQIEHMSSASAVTAVYPRITLGPGQRFASRGCYVVALGETADKPSRTVSEWIVP